MKFVRYFFALLFIYVSAMLTLYHLCETQEDEAHRKELGYPPPTGKKPRITLTLSSLGVYAGNDSCYTDRIIEIMDSLSDCDNAEYLLAFEDGSYHMTFPPVEEYSITIAVLGGKSTIYQCLTTATRDPNWISWYGGKMF